MIVLDTHAWIWWSADPGMLSTRARHEMEQSAEVGVCAMSCWEVAMLVSKGRLDFDRDPLLWIRKALAAPRVRLLPLTPEVAVTAAGLPAGFPGDPADRMIAATALLEKAPLVTKDARLRAFGELSTIW